ncbi:MAG: hypothetical protein QXH81_09055 [Thermofilaceae archaeon]
MSETPSEIGRALGWGGVVGAEGVHGEAARAIEEALRALREIEERVARESSSTAC